MEQTNEILINTVYVDGHPNGSYYQYDYLHNHKIYANYTNGVLEGDYLKTDK